MTALDVAQLRDEFREPHELVRTSDGKILFLRSWPGTAGNDLAVLVFHGVTAYSEPYGKLIAEELARSGPNVFGMDLRGHGRSDGVRGDYPGPERLSKDLCETLTVLKARFAHVVVLGHSLGVLLAGITAQNCHALVDGLILISAGRQVRPGAHHKPAAGAALKALLGLTLFPARTWIEYNRPGMRGRDDPLFNFWYSARFYSSVYGTSAGSVVRRLRRNQIDSPNLASFGKPGVPVLVGVGDQDELFSVDSAKAFYESIGCDRKAFFVIPGARHAAFPPGSWGPLVAWLGKHYPTKSGGSGGAAGS